MATTAFAVLVLAVLVQLGRPARGSRAVVRGVVVLSRLGDRRRERLRGPLDPLPPPAGPGRVAGGPCSDDDLGPALRTCHGSLTAPDSAHEVRAPGTVEGCCASTSPRS